MSKLNLYLEPRKRVLMLVGLATIVLAGCVQMDFVRDYPLAGYPSYSTSGGAAYYPNSYYSGGPYSGAYGAYYGNGYYPRNYYPGGYFAGAYYPFSRGLYNAGDRYSPFPDYYYFDHNHLRYGCLHPSHRGGNAAPLNPPVASPPVVQPDESGPRPKAPRGRNGGPVKDWRNVDNSEALVNRSPTAVRSPPASSAPPALTNPVPPPVSAGTMRGRDVIPRGRDVIPRGTAVIQTPAVRAPVPVVTRPQPAAVPRSEPGTRVERSERGPGLQRAR